MTPTREQYELAAKAAEHGLNSGVSGMSLRDYFAAEAMQTQDWTFYGGARETESSIAADARRCYRIADAMIKARTI